MALLRSLRQTLALDYRSLALYRMLMGLVVMADVLYRLPDLVNFYTDDGLIPRSTFVSEMAMDWSFSLHLANGSTAFAAVMFGLHFLVGLALCFGFKTRWAMALAWLFTVSVHNRNWVVNNGGDDIMRAIFFLSIFLPLNKCFSIDSALTKPKEELEQKDYFSFWSLAFFFQVFAIYFVSYILKDHDTWRKDFTALYYASRLDIFATPISHFLRQFTDMQKVLTFLTAYLEWLGPLLLVFSAPFGRHWWKVRLGVIASFWALHFGIILNMWIGVFPYLCLGMWAIFLPPQFWDRLQARWRQRGWGKLTIYFDGECGFCQKGVLILRELFLLPEVRILEAQSDDRAQKEMKEQHSWVVVNGSGERFFHFAAMLEVFRNSPGLRYLVPVLRPFRGILHHAYVWVSHHRPLFGKLTQFLEYRSPKKPLAPVSWLKEGAGAFILVTLIMWNLTTIKKWNVKAPFFQSVTRWLHIYQEWNMFAPFPKMDNIWVEIPAVLEDQSQIELLTGSRDVYSVKSAVFPGLIPNEHWRKFYLNLSDSTDYARYYGGFLCRRWNTRKIRWVKDQTLRKFEIIIYSQMNFLDNKKAGIMKKLSWKHWCYNEDMKKDNVVPEKK